MRLRGDPLPTQQYVAEKHWQITAHDILGKTKVERLKILWQATFPGQNSTYAAIFWCMQRTTRSAIIACFSNYSSHEIWQIATRKWQKVFVIGGFVVFSGHSALGEVTSDPMLQNKVAKRFFNHFIYKSKENAQKSGIFKRFSCSSLKRNPKILNRFSLTSPIIEIFWENTFKFDSS